MTVCYFCWNMVGVENIKDKNGEVRVQSADIDVVALSEIDKQAVIGVPAVLNSGRFIVHLVVVKLEHKHN